MEAAPQQTVPESSATATSRTHFVDTREHNRFIEFCDACRQYRYIGLCFGAPGIGKTLSAVKYSRAEEVRLLDSRATASLEAPFDTVLYTPSVVNAPGRIDMEVRNARETLRLISAEPIRAEARQVLDGMRLRDDQWRKEKAEDRTYCGPKFPPFQPTYYQVVQQFETRKSAVPDPTTLILIDEADRLGMNSLEQVRSIFDESDVALILIGMPGIEKRMARLPQFYSRIGFVHEFRPLGTAEVQSLLESGWAPSGIALPLEPFKPDVLAAIIRMTGGNFRLLNRLLTQIERLLKLNEAQTATLEIVDAARESLVIGQA